MSSEITYLSQKLHRLKIKKTPRQKKYLISQETRDFLKSQKVQTIGLIPFQVKTRPIFNPKREFFLNNTDFLINEDTMINISINNSTNNQDKTKEKIISYMLANFNIQVSVDLVRNILEVENSKILIYTINLSGIEISLTKPQSSSIISQMENLEITQKNKFKLVSILDFYTEVKFQKSKKELYQNILAIRQNKTNLQKCIPLTITPNNIVQIPYHLIYQRLFGD